MPLPTAVLEQIERAKQIHKAEYGEGAKPAAQADDPAAAAPPPDGIQPPPDQPPVEAPPTPPPSGDTAIAGSLEALQAQNAELRAQLERLMAQHSTLKGKYDSEPGRLAADNSALQRELRALNEENQRLRDGLARPEAAGIDPAQAKEADANAFTKWFEDTYGPEHMEEFQKFVRNQVKEETGEFRQVVEKVTATAEKTEKEKYWAALDEKVPGWEAIYNDPRFANILREEEGNTGRPKSEFAKQWEDSLNPDRIIPYLEDYQKRFGKPVQVPAKTTARKNKADFVAPNSTAGGAGGPAPRPGDDVPFVRASEISQLALEVNTTRRWVGREKELAVLKARHNAAIAANRVLAGQ